MELSASISNKLKACETYHGSFEGHLSLIEYAMSLFSVNIPPQHLMLPSDLSVAQYVLARGISTYGRQ